MTDDGVIQLRRNPAAKISNSRTHLSRFGKGKGSSTRLAKYNVHSRSGIGLHKGANGSSQSLASIETLPPHQAIGGENGQSGSHRMTKRAANHPTGSVLRPHRHKGLSNGMGNLAQSNRKSVIQLEKDIDDSEESNGNDSNSFEDLDDNDDVSEDENLDSNSSRLNVGIQPVEPTPPKLSDETVISVSSFADMASALKESRDKSGFVDNDDLISTAVNRSKNLGDMAQMVHGWVGGSSSRAAMAGAPLHPSASVVNMKRHKQNNAVPGEEDPREFEKVFREYTNTRAVKNPVISSLCRISVSQRAPSPSAASTSSLYSFSQDSSNTNNSASVFQSSTTLGSIGRNSKLPLPSVKKVNSLVATTSHQISDYSERGNIMLPDGHSSMPQSRGPNGGGPTSFILNKIWQSGWTDPDSSKSVPHDNIHGQAIRVQNRLAKTKAKERYPAQVRESSQRLSSL